MNIRIFTILVASFICTISVSKAQQILSGTYVERTNQSPKIGLNLGARFTYSLDYYGSRTIDVGAFYQKDASQIGFGESPQKRLYEKEFYGIYFEFPMMQFKAASVNLNVRTGVVNAQNFAITPSVNTSLRISKSIEFNVGMGVRNFRPTIQSGIKMNLSR